MALSPEEEPALNPHLTVTEVTKILRRHRPPPDKRYYATNDGWIDFWVGRNVGKQEQGSWLGQLLFRKIILSSPDPPPDRLPDSRGRLRNKVLKWLVDPNRNWHLFWITDPFLLPGITASAQLFTDIAAAMWRLGAITSYFHEVKHLVLDIVSQLIRRYPPYRKLALTELAGDFTIFERSPRVAFRKLIFEPWKTLAITHPFYFENPPLIIVTFQPYFSEHGATQVVELITECSGLDLCPLLWLICSRPKATLCLMRTLLKANRWAVYAHETLSLDDIEAKGYVGLYLRNGLQEIHTYYSDAFFEGDVWPTREQLVFLINGISSVDAFAYTILRFIGAEEGNPKQRLEACLVWLADAPAPSGVDPFQTLNHFLQRLLVNIAPNAIPLLCLRERYQGLKIRELAHLLGLRQAECYRSIKVLHCFFQCSSLDDIGESTLEIIDEGFRHFCGSTLRSIHHPGDSTPFGLVVAGARLRILRESIQVLSCSSMSGLLEGIRWSMSTPNNDFTTACILKDVIKAHVDFGATEGELFYLMSFDFCHLVGKSFPPYSLRLIARHIHYRISRDLVRTKPLTALDINFIDRCKMLASPMDFSKDEFGRDGTVDNNFSEDDSACLIDHSNVVIYTLDLLEGL